MASSFVQQIPSIVHLITKLSPKRVLDIGKGFGKYGFLIHEYLGIDNSKSINPLLTMAQQSRVKIDAVEIDPDLMMPHLIHLYSDVFFGDILKLYKEKDFSYDLILMIDIIEHIDKNQAIAMLKHFINKKTMILVATPKDFFQQELYESDFEHHVSHWNLADFKAIGNVQSQNFNGGIVYLLSEQKMQIRGFGNSPIQKARRVASLIKNEFFV